MSSGGFQTVLISAPPVSSSSSLHLASSPSEKTPESHPLDSHMLLKRESSPDVASPGYVIEQQTSQATLQTIDADYNSNSFNFSYDGSFSLSPQQSVDHLEKGDSGGGILHGPPLSSSSNASPKASFLAINEDKGDKMISGFDGRVDGLSPLSVIAVSAYQDAGHPSPNVPSSILSSRTGTTHVLRFHPAGHDTMLSALNYSDSELGGFDSGHTFGTLDGLLGAGGAPGMRLPDLLDQEAYMETELSPQAFHNSGDTFSVRENSPLAGLTENSHVKTDIKNKISENTSTNLAVDKLKVKGSRPVKATSPSRPGTQPCPTCGKVFSNSSALTKHKLTHSDERKYVCQLCAKAFKRQDHLNGHMLTHRNKKPFECDAEGCGKSYCDARSLRRHKENHHSNTSSNLSTSQVSVIPGLAHLGFNSLQTSFPASVITSASGTSFTESSLSNRIQYAPPPTTNSRTPTTTSTDSVARTAASATSHLQFLTFQQASAASKSQSDKGVPRSEGLSSWQPQTINTGALLLAQNFGSSQLVSRGFDQQEQGSSSGSEQSQLKQQDIKKEILSQDREQQLEQTCFQVVDSTGAKKLLTLTPQGPMNLQFEPSPEVVHLQDRGDSVLEVVQIHDGTDSVFSRTSMQIVKIEASDQSSSVPTTPTAKEAATANGPQLSSPLLQQLLNQHQSEVSGTVVGSRTEHSFLSLGDQHKQSSSQQSSVLMSAWSQVPFTGTNSTSNSRFNSSQDPKPVECSLCQRKFKNIPALNGHMRLHGGYFKKENDAKKNDKKNNSSHTPLQTASTNVRALIEEKINQKRNFLTPTSVSNTTLPNNTQPPPQTFDFRLNHLSTQQPTSNFIVQNSPIASPIVQEAPVFNDFPSQSSDLNSFPDTSHASDLNDLNQRTCDILKKLDLKEQFRVPHPPTEKHRRHSDSDHFILPKRPCATFTSTALADLLRNRVVAKRTCRTGSDPGEPLNLEATLSELADSLIDLPKFTSLLPPMDDLHLKKFSVDDSVNLVNSIMPSHHKFSMDNSDNKKFSLDDSVNLVNSIMPEDGSTLPVLSAEDIPEAQTYLPELDTQCLDRGVFFDGSHNDLPEISVSELEMMQFASIVTSTATLPSEIKPVNGGGKIRMGEDSNDDDVFLSPTSLPTSPLKHKKKRRPEPIYIPPYVNTSHFHSSRLRSPRRLQDHQKSLSPPPYTPPPMLSPVRSGSGLFWHILSGSGSLTPKSAPITPSFGLGRKASISESISETEEDYEEVPESDSVPHVNIGSNYQAKIPPFNPHLKNTLMVKHQADKVWDPTTMESLTDEEVELYLDLSCCALVPGGGRNKEYALHLLQICKGNIKDAILSLMDYKPKLPPHHPLLTFQYSENDQWSPEEIEAYHQALLKCDKDFFSIAKEIPGKSVKQCIQFYYLWKKVCPDEYKRIRFIRRRKEQESLIYNLRSKEEEVEEKVGRRNASPSPNRSTPSRRNDEITEKHTVVNGSVSTSKTSEVKTTSVHGNMTSVSTSTYNGSGLSSTYDFTIEPLEEFPCKICGKVFSKVKSRSAHMKSHRQTDNDKRHRYES